MKPRKHLLLVASLIFIMMSSVVQFANASPGLEIALTLDRFPPVYDLGEFVSVEGNLTWDGSPISDGIVGLQIDDPNDNPFIFRTLPTGIPPAEGWIVEILSVIPCDSQGNPKQIFNRDSNAHFLFSIRNNDVVSRFVRVCVTIFDVYMNPLYAAIKLATSIDPGASQGLLFPWPVPEDAPLGNATIHISAFNELPSSSARGHPYCPEKSAVFTIESPLGAEPSPSYPEGTYGLTFKLPWNGKAGVYDVYAAAEYADEWAFSSKMASVNIPEYPFSPIAFFTYSPLEPYANMTITFDASGSLPEGVNDTIVNYVWNFDDGTPPVSTTNPEIFHIFAQARIYTVTLNVTDSEDLWDTTSNPINVSRNFGPTADFIWYPSLPSPDESVTFDASLSSLGWNGTGYSPIINYTWNFGDGNITTVYDSIVNHVYASEGNYTIDLTITDSQGLQSSKSEEIIVTMAPPLVGDVNGDGTVNVLDAILLASAYGSEIGDPNWDPRCDLNKDDFINILDAILLALNFGESL